MINNSEKYIIIEIIPTTSKRETGDIAQISALKLNGLSLLDRFDYRINKDKINNPSILEIISYDDDLFTYLNSTDELIEEFKNWSEDLPILILDNDYTKDYLKDLNNKKISISKYLNKEYTDNFIDELIEEYNLEPSNYIVDLLYESLINKNNS